MASNGIDFRDYIEKRTLGFSGREWLFKEIDNWIAQEDGPRYFILSGEPGSGKSAAAARYTQKSHLDGQHFCIAGRAETIDPVEFTRSLSLQLTRLDRFAAALLEEQGVHVDVNIDIQENYGTVIGINIEKLLIKTRQPKKAFNEAILLPLNTLYDGGYARTILVLVDGLDESEQFEGSDNIYELLAGLGGLDGRVRFLLTVRSRSRAERRFENLPAQRIKLDDARDNRKDVEAYIQARYSASKIIRYRLKTDQVALIDFIGTLQEKHQDNFHYLSLLFAALERGERWVDDLHSLPAGLDGIYREYLRTRALGKNTAIWRSYRPVLGVLAAGAEPLTAHQVEIFSGLEAQTVGDVLLDAGEFLDEKPGNSPEHPPRYSLYHRSLADFLGDRAKAGDEFWIDLEAVHRKIGAIYEPAISTNNWRKIDDYGLMHAAQHLFAGSAYDKLAYLLEPGWLQARFKQDGYRYSGFLADVDIAWRAAELQDVKRLQQGERMANWAVQARCALIEASIRSLAANVPPGLLVRLVDTGIWTTARAIGLAAQAPDLQMRIDGLCGLLNGGKLDMEQSAEVVRLIKRNNADPACIPAQASGGQIPGMSFSAETLSVRQRSQIKQALERVLKRTDDYEEWLPSFGKKTKTLMAELSEILAPDDMSEIQRRGYLNSHLGIRPSVNAQIVLKSEWSAALVLALGLAFPAGKMMKTFQTALDKVETIQLPAYYALGLWALAPYVPAPVQEHFLDLALGLPAGEIRTMILDRLAAVLLPEALRKAADAIPVLQEDYLAKMTFYTALALESQREDWCKVASEYAIQNSGKLTGEDRDAFKLLMAKLVEFNPAEWVETVMNLAPRGLSTSNLRVLGMLLPEMEPQRSAALAKESIQLPYELEMEGYLAPTFIRVWPYLDQDDQIHYLGLLHVDHLSFRKQIIDKMPTEVTEADWEDEIVTVLLEVTAALRDDFLPCLENLLPHLKPVHLQRALTMAQEVSDVVRRLSALLLLAPNISETQRKPLVKKIMDEIQGLTQDQAVELLPALARSQPGELMESAQWAMGVLIKSLRAAPGNGRGEVIRSLGDLTPAWAVISDDDALEAVFRTITELDQEWEWI